MSVTLPGYIRLPGVRRDQLLHVPGSYLPPVIGQTQRFLRDPLAYCRDVHARYGEVSRGYFLFEPRINLMSAAGNEFVLLDRAHNFSAYQGWHPVLGHLFPRGLMLRDGDDHRQQRRLMQGAFRSQALADYLTLMTPRINTAVDGWLQQGELRFYPAIKRLTLEIAAEVFLGLSLQSEVDQVNHDFAAVVDASAAINRLPLIGRLYARGRAARTRLATFLHARVAQRRGGNGRDLFTQLCQARDEDGRSYADDEIVDHLIFLMMAAHDTTTSALTTIAYALAKHPQWQTQLRADAQALRKTQPEAADMDALERYGWVLREALRLYPPLTTILRRSVRDCEFQGYAIPAGTAVNVFPLLTQRLEQWWSQPDDFDPERFSPARAEHRRHAFAWVPFGGGAHMCLGLHFAEMQVKAVLFPLLLRAQIEVGTRYQIPYQLAPIAKPRDGLPLTLRGL